jgi:hypothetical protein
VTAFAEHGEAVVKMWAERYTTFFDIFREVRWRSKDRRVDKSNSVGMRSTYSLNVRFIVGRE